MLLSAAEIYSFQEMIFTWWEENKRDLPWRHSRDPYVILVSECMLQQTQVVRVVPVFQAFIKRFPTVGDLASAGSGEVLRMWKGMGYNRRAVSLLSAAKIIVTDFKGNFPANEQQLLSLPGLGKYTVRAIMVFAYEKDVPVVDTNIRKIITHFFFHDVPQNEPDIEAIATQLVPEGKSWAWHQALMDYGALELPKIVNHKSFIINRKKAIPFRETKRFYRGRIVDRLRAGSIEEDILCRECMQNYGKTEDYHEEILEDLEKDKLVTRKNGIVSLPD